MNQQDTSPFVQLPAGDKQRPSVELITDVLNKYATKVYRFDGTPTYGVMYTDFPHVAQQIIKERKEAK